jgi:predicted O-methyltransferase YrrM
LGNRLFQVWSYFIFWLKKEDKYSIHSPLLFKVYRELFNFISERKKQDIDIEEFRQLLLTSNETIEILDLGAGSKKVNTLNRKVSAVTKYSTSSRKISRLLQFFCTLTPALHVIELGTCVGINTRYLARETKGSLATFEGSPELARIAKLKNFEPALDIIIGEIKDTLPEYLSKIEFVDFVFIDANHTYTATLAYFKTILTRVHSGSIIAIGDIHWSQGMETAWKEIIELPEIKLSLDFYEVGILFFEFPGEKEHYILDF